MTFWSLVAFFAPITPMVTTIIFMCAIYSRLFTYPVSISITLAGKISITREFYLIIMQFVVLKQKKKNIE